MARTKTYKAVMHFNKPGARTGKPWTVHFRGACHVVAEIRCLVPMVSEFKPTKPTNPRAFFSAQAAHLIVHDDGVAVLYPHQPPTTET